jgi:NADPH-dependent 2,4-dienoyl-CoA reductase/sulfur reductase-like enzyme
VRALVVGGGERALAVARTLAADGHAPRVVVEDPADAAAARDAGGEPWEGTPDRIGTLRYALDNVTVVLWLLGDRVEGELHGSRLEMLLERLIDTTVRGFVYERGPGEALVREKCSYNEIPHAVVEPSVDAVLDGIEAVLAADRSAAS